MSGLLSTNPQRENDELAYGQPLWRLTEKATCRKVFARKEQRRRSKEKEWHNNFNNSHNIIRCTTHRKKKTLFCMDDTSLVCGHCMVCLREDKPKGGEAGSRHAGGNKNYIQLDNHKGHNAAPVSSAAKILLPKLQERVTNLPAVHHELKSIVTKLDEHINEMLMV